MPINDAVVLHNFERSGYYGFTLNIPDQFQGFIAFIDNLNSEPAIFGINPQETENSDVKTSTVRSTGTGSVQYPVIVRSRDNIPLNDVFVWITTDPIGEEIVAGVLTTNANGQVTFFLYPGNYYLWRRHNSYSFLNPQRISV